ncbi:thioredoxin family protein [Rubrivirga sp. IMCC43871]|uniref:thioredoxin family protein n=1 Tax=Rubrivirga sp. IMCC43871 TaxID=3391575 RepID=UPI00398FA5BF
MTKVLLAALSLALAPVALAQVDASVVPDDAPVWFGMEEAIAKAQAEDRVILVYGYASWCGYCARFDANVFTDDAVQAYLNEHYAPTRLDLEDETTMQFFNASVTGVELGQAMAISGTPTSVFVDTDGALITKFPGYTDAETFLYVLKYVHEEAYETTAFDAYVVAQRTGLTLTPALDDLRAPQGQE